MFFLKHFIFWSIVNFKGLDFTHRHLKAPAEYIAEEMARKSAARTTEIRNSALRTSQSRTKIKWFEQPLNHFDPEDKRKFKMKYFVDDSFWVAHGPIFIYINGEVAASDNLNSLLLYQVAEDTNGLVIGTEHRYFGESQPPLNLFWTDNLKYLHTRQALADLARLIEAIKATPTAACSKVVVAGGSYAGSLAAWMRMTYPNLVYAAVSSGGPVLAKKNFHEFMDVVAYDYGKYGLPGCYEELRKIFHRYAKMFETSYGIEQLKREKNICMEDDMSIPQNKQYFFFAHIAELVYSTQLGTGEQMRQNCSDLMRSGKLEAVPSSSSADKNCQHYLYSDYLEIEKVESRLWVYLLCTEFGFSFISSPDDTPFTGNIPVEFCTNKCPYFFGPDFNEQRIDASVARTNKMYGGLEPPVTNVLFVNGEADPWSPATVRKPLPYNPTVIVIPGATHCRDLYYINHNDSSEVARAKHQIVSTVKEWVRKKDVDCDLKACINKNRDDKLVNLIQERNMIQDPISEAL